MKRKPNASAAAAELRRHAEVRLKMVRAPAAGPQTNAATKCLVHELQIHQVELEVQNAELSRARAEAEANAEKFFDLYDFAPVGYFTFAPQGDILGVNLTGAALLGVERQRLLHRRFQLWVAPECLKGFNEFLQRTFGSGTRQTCEVTLLKTGKACLPVQIDGCRVLNPATESQCRAVVVDLTERKRVEEEISTLNAELEARVAARTAEISALLQESRHMQEQLRHLSHLVLRAQEEERKRISRELHDQIAQTLICLNFDLMALARVPAPEPGALRRRIARTQRLVENAVNVLHQFARELRPPVLDDLGLIPALHSYMKDFTRQTGVRTHLAAFTLGRIKGLNSAKRMVLYRVTQAALTNVARHANASRAKVRIQKGPGCVRLEIADNGQGFQVAGEPASKRHQHLGLLGMKERAEMVGGTFNLESAPGQGTTIQVEIPLDKGDEAGRG